jgi:hypothetical protein
MRGPMKSVMGLPVGVGLLSSKISKFEYLLRDEFTTNLAAGSVNGTLAEPGPGTRVVVDTNLRISIAAGRLSFATGELQNDGLWLDSVPRVAGRVAAAEITLANTSGSPAVGVDNNALTSIVDRVVFSAAGVLNLNVNGTTNLAVGSYTATQYNVALVMRPVGMYWFIKGGAFTNWTLLYISEAGSGSGFIGTQTVGTAGVFSSSILCVPKSLWVPTILCSDTFTRSNGAIGVSEPTGPEGQAVASRVYSGTTWTVNSNTARNTPVTFGAEDITNGNMETGDPPSNWTSVGATLDRAADERTGGTGVSSLSVANAGAATGFAEQVLDSPDGTWMRLTLYSRRVTGDPFWGFYESDNSLINTTGGTSASWTLRTMTARLKGAGCKIRLSVNSAVAGEEARFDDVSCVPLTLSELITVFNGDTPSVVASVNITGASFGPAGLVACCDSASNPQNLVLAHVKGGDITLEKCVGGTWTRLIWTAVTQVVGGTLTLITYRSGADLKLRLYYNGAMYGTEQTIADAGIVSNVLHGLLATDSAQPNQLDKYLLVPRGAEGQHNGFLDLALT